MEPAPEEMLMMRGLALFCKRLMRALVSRYGPVALVSNASLNA